MTVGVLLRVVLETPPEAPGRYEVRVWPRETPEAALRLQRDWPQVGAERRADIYLVTAQSPWSLVKLRDGARLEIKRRGPDRGILQFWTCPVSAPFPLTPAILAELALALGHPGSLPPEAARTPAHLLAALASHPPVILPVTVRKARLTFRRGTCRAEICRATVLGRDRLSLAVEDPDPGRALAAVAALGLDGLTNRSFGDMLRPRALSSTGARGGRSQPQNQRRTP